MKRIAITLTMMTIFAGVFDISAYAQNDGEAANCRFYVFFSDTGATKADTVGISFKDPVYLMEKWNPRYPGYYGIPKPCPPGPNCEGAKCTFKQRNFEYEGVCLTSRPKLDPKKVDREGECDCIFEEESEAGDRIMNLTEKSEVPGGVASSTHNGTVFTYSAVEHCIERQDCSGPCIYDSYCWLTGDITFLATDKEKGIEVYCRLGEREEEER